LMFKPGDKLNPYDPAALDLPGDEGVQRRLEAGTSPMTPELAEVMNDPTKREDLMNTVLHIMRRDAAERERTGETVEQQIMREKLEWAQEDAKSAELKIKGNDAFKIGDYKTAYVIYTACIYLSGHEPLYHLNKAAVALSELSSQRKKLRKQAISKGNFNRAKAHFRRGQAMYFLGKWDKAGEDYAIALTLQPGDRSVVDQVAELN
ncbi:TPR-like protein, partial [Mycena capillaripes]